MGQAAGRKALRRVYWASFVVLIDISIQGFDLLFDPVGYLMLASAAAALAAHEQAFRAVQTCAYVLAIFSVATVVRAVRSTAEAANGTVDSIGRWNLSGSADIAIEQGLTFTVFADMVAAVVVGWCLVWFLLTGISRIAEHDGLPAFADKVRSIRRFVMIVLVAIDVLGLASLAVGVEDELTPLLFAGVAAAVVAGILGLRAVWDASKDLLFVEPAPVGDGGDSPKKSAVVLALVAGLVGLGNIAGSLAEEVFDPYDSVVMASNLQPPGLSQGRYLEIDVSTPRSEAEQGPFEFDTFGFDEDRGWSESCRSLSALSSIDLGNGEIRWTQDIPRQYSNQLMIVDNSVFILDDRVGRLLPSVAALDPVSGDLQWQYFFEAANARFYGQREGQVAISIGDFYNRDSGRVLVLDDDGTVEDEFDDKLIERGRHLDDIQGDSRGEGATGYTLWPVPDPRNWRVGQREMLSDYQIDELISGVDDQGRQAVLSWGWDRSMAYHDTATGDVTRAEPLAPNSLYNSIGNRHSPGDPLQHNNHLTIVLLASHQGPNSRLSVYDPESANKVWEIEHVRSAALAGPNVLYDKRNEAALHEVVTRDLFLVDGTDPENILWQTELSVNAAGGNGYLGSITGDSGEQLVFVVEGTAEGFEDEFLLLPATPDSSTPIPQVLRAGGRLGGGPSHLTHVDAEVLVAADRASLMWQQRAGPTQRLDLGEEEGATTITSLAVVENTLLVEHNGTRQCATGSTAGDKLVIGPTDTPFTLPEPETEPDQWPGCQAPTATLTGVDPRSATTVWTMAIPGQAMWALAFDGTSIVVADQFGNNSPPTLTSIETKTGVVNWQRLFNAQSLTLQNVGDANHPAVVVMSNSPYRFPGDEQATLSIIDAQGTVVHDFADGSEPWDPPTVIGLPGYRIATNRNDDRQAVSREPGTTQAVVGFHSDLVILDTDNNPVRAESPLFGSTWSTLGNEHSVGDPVQVGEGFAMVLLGSHTGPNSKLKVFDTVDGSLIWTADHIRSAAAAGPYVLYDKRNNEPADADFTRALFLVDPRNPEDVVWTAKLKVNDHGGNGFIGVLEPEKTRDAQQVRLVFVTESATRQPRVQILDLNRPTSWPTEIRAAGTVGGGRSPVSHLGPQSFDGRTPEVVVAADGGGILWQLDDNKMQRLDLGSLGPVVSLDYSADGMIIVEQQQPDSC